MSHDRAGCFDRAHHNSVMLQLHNEMNCLFLRGIAAIRSGNSLPNPP
jgi:hypothetical protein